jgi:HD-like signal output (HDOD) protein
LVNSAFYGLAAGKVTTVTRAVVVLGFENIRLATLSLVLFEHFKNKSNAVDLKEVLASSFWAGTLARDIAKMTGDIDPEEAFVCAMMNQLGKLLMIYYQPKKYRKISDRIQSHKENETKAAKAVCGVTYEELGMAVAKQWSFPSQIRDCMPLLKKTDLKNKKNPPNKLWILSSFVKELGQIIKFGPLYKHNKDMSDLLKHYQKKIKISEDQLKILIKDSLEKVQKHANAMHLGINNSVFIEYLANFFSPASKQLSVSGPLSNKTSSSISFQLTDFTEQPKGNVIPIVEKAPKDIIMEGIQEISSAMMADQDINDVALISLEVLYRALQFHRALMFAREEAGQSMQVRYGYGDNVQQLIRNARFKTDGKKDLFNLSIQVGKDLIVADAYDPKLNELIPSWYRKHIDAPAFIFLPVVFKNICIGAFYADRDKNGPPISETEHHHLSMLRNQLILAIKYR